MVLESTIVCVDNSEYMRNGDYNPTRLLAQADAVSLICSAKTRSNPENNVGLVTFNNGRVIVTLTSEVPKLLANLHQIQPLGMINFETGIRVAHLALKHRQGRNHKMRIIAFVGSPVAEDEKELIRIAKRLKKEKVNVDLIIFGQEQGNSEKMKVFIDTLNGKEGTSSHLVTINPGPQLVEALLSSPVIQGEDGAGGVGGQQGGFDFGLDPNDDPELALALRVSMEEQRARQEAESRQQPGATGGGAAAQAGGSAPADGAPNVFASVAQEAGPSGGRAGDSNFSAMTEEEQLAYAMQMSMNDLDEPKPDEEMDTTENPDDSKKP
ncbi:26S proteasome non-ATPase regulatory subunit 4 [Hypsibius exemplaris]|uniref:26S proteasome non-ATPase regulatory subunit 4 n=1 Tax=Hypsibius exemplaris TaxID=2072580 RepID=A0A9X6NJ28_HYPEX|nr:26S proteasome non-ATPase regulatory subunit 4 [Hypsibius exemplaris]